MRPIISMAIAVAASALIIACGGNGGSTPAPTPSPTPTPAPSPPPTSAPNPCSSASLAPSSEVAASLPRSISATASRKATRPDSAAWRFATRTATADKKTADGFKDLDPRGTLASVLWNHRLAQTLLAPADVFTPLDDVGDVAVIQDEGDLITPANAFDIPNIGVRYAPKAGGGYDVSRVDASFRTAIGNRVTLGDDDSVAMSVAFGFTFYGAAQSAAFVNSDGNITFGEEDRASSARDIARLVSGPPRIAPFLADLDPSVGGTIFVRSATDAFTATWCAVRVFDSTRQVTLQTSFFPDGSVEMKYASTPAFTAVEGVVGISPGHTTAFQAADLSTTANAAISGTAGAIGERFAPRPDLDLVALSRKFYRNHPDSYDQLVVWTDQLLVPENAFSFEVLVANEIAGIGLDVFDISHDVGSGGRLRSLVQMDSLAKFPDDPTRKFLGENTTLSVLGQEAGHRWLAFLQFTDHNRQRSDALLGRDQAHWSFFFNSDASVMEGNRIQDLGGGSFRTTAAVEKYSLLDQYAMGLVRDVDVPPMFYVESPTNVQGGATAESAPRVGITFNGTRRDVLINDVIEAMGRRQPAADGSPKVHRQAFLYVIGRGRTADSAAIAKIDRIRSAWETFFRQATDGRARAETRLRPPT